MGNADGSDSESTTPARPWWVRPTLITLATYAVALAAIIIFIGWSLPVVVVLAIGLVLGTFWFRDQKPR